MPAQFDDRLGIYISIPFCRSKCTYCNFSSGVYPASEHARYVDRLVEDLRHASDWAAKLHLHLPRSVDTIFLGGGTPSLLAPDLIEQLFSAIRSCFDLAPDAEITVECAPGQIAEATLAAFNTVGVNRASLGVQSFVDREAQVSGRLHNRKTVLEDLARLRQAGIANLNVDLIAGLAGQTLASWNDSLSVLIDSGVPHASIYMLEVDEDSRLGREMLAGGARYFAELVPSDDAMAQMYDHAIERLKQTGLMQYEISNFSRPGFASRHNLRYWRRRPYLGVGLDASSALYASSPFVSQRPNAALNREPCPPLLRSTTASDLATFLAASQEPAEAAWITPQQQQEESWFLGLRLNQGVDLQAIELEFGAESVARAIDVVNSQVANGLLTFDGKTVCLTARGRLLSNEVFQGFLALDTRELNHA